MKHVMHLVPQTIYLEILFIQNLNFAREFVSNVFLFVCLFVCVCVCVCVCVFAPM